MLQNIMIGILVLAAIWAVWHSVRRFRRGSGCCGEHETAEKRVAVRDSNPSHYPHQAELTIGGMTCENCARRVENALNTLDGVWAKVDIGSRSAKVLLKESPDKTALSRTVAESGYVVTECRIIR